MALSKKKNVRFYEILKTRWLNVKFLIPCRKQQLCPKDKHNQI